MAIEKGTVSTTELTADRLKIDMVDEFKMVDDDYSQFTTLTRQTSTSQTTREKFQWMEHDLFPRLAVVAGGGYLIGATSVTVAAGQGAHIRVGDVLRNMARGDAMWVTGVAGDVLTVVRNVGVTPAVAGTAGDTLLIMSNAAAQGADFGQTAILLPTFAYNFTQIFRHGYTFSNTASKIELYGGREPGKESALKGVEHQRAIEYSAFWGARDMKTDPVSGEPTGFTGGLVEFITTNKQDVAGALTVDYLDTFLTTALRTSGSDVVMFVNPRAAGAISRFNRGGQGTAWRPSRENVAGLKVDAFMSGVYGYEVPIVVKKDWLDFPTTLKQYGGWIFIVDRGSIRRRPLRDRDTALLTARQHPGADRISEEYLTEMGWEISNEKNHSILYGIT
jgi:hypothetical protein